PRAQAAGVGAGSSHIEVVRSFRTRSLQYAAKSSHLGYFRIDNSDRLRYSRNMRLYGRKFSRETQHWTRHQRIVLLTLIGANVAFFVTQLSLDAFQPGFVRTYLALISRGIHDADS